MGVRGVAAVAVTYHDVVAEDVLERDRARIGRPARDLVVERVNRAHGGAAGDGDDLGAVGHVAAHVGRVAVDQPAVVVQQRPSVPSTGALDELSVVAVTGVSSPAVPDGVSLDRAPGRSAVLVPFSVLWGRVTARTFM